MNTVHLMETTIQKTQPSISWDGFPAMLWHFLSWRTNVGCFLPEMEDFSMFTNETLRAPLYYEYSLLITAQLHSGSPKPLASLSCVKTLSTCSWNAYCQSHHFHTWPVSFHYCDDIHSPCDEMSAMFPLHHPNHPQVTMATAHKYHLPHTALVGRRVCDRGDGCTLVQRRKETLGNSVMFLPPTNLHHIRLVSQTSVQK